MKKLFSPFPHVLPIALTSGHTFVVTQEPVEVPDMYVAEALSRGALEDEAAVAPALEPTAATGSAPANSAQVITPSAEQLAKDRAEKIKEALVAMVDGSDEADFTGSGAPQLARVKARVGFAVTRSEVDAVWTEVSAKL